MSVTGVDHGAVLVLPPPEAAGHRHDVGVAELLQRAGGERGAHAAGAVDDDRRRLVDDAGLDLGLEVATGDVHGAGQRALVVLVGLADVERERPGSEALGRVGGADLGDLGLGGRQQIAERSHALKATCPVGNSPVHGQLMVARR